MELFLKASYTVATTIKIKVNWKPFGCDFIESLFVGVFFKNKIFYVFNYF